MFTSCQRHKKERLITKLYFIPLLVYSLLTLHCQYTWSLPKSISKNSYFKQILRWDRCYWSGNQICSSACFLSYPLFWIFCFFSLWYIWIIIYFFIFLSVLSSAVFNLLPHITIKLLTCAILIFIEINSVYCSVLLFIFIKPYLQVIWCLTLYI